MPRHADPSQLQSGLDQKADKLDLVGEITSSFVPQLYHKFCLIPVGNANVKLPADASVPFEVGDWFDFYASNATPCTFSDDNSSTVLAAGGATALAARYSGASAVKVAANTWLVVGNFAS